MNFLKIKGCIEKNKENGFVAEKYIFLKKAAYIRYFIFCIGLAAVNYSNLSHAEEAVQKYCAGDLSYLAPQMNFEEEDIRLEYFVTLVNPLRALEIGYKKDRAFMKFFVFPDPNKYSENSSRILANKTIMWEELKKQVECINNGGVIDPTYSEPASKEEKKERAIYMFHDHGASYLAHQAKSKAESAAILEKMQRRNDEREQQSKILGVVLAGIVGAKNIAIQNKQAQIQKKNEILATQQAQVQAQQAQSAANAKQLADYDRQYVKHDTPGSQNQSSGNYGASSDNSNSSNTNQQARPHKERVNLPSQTGCINMGKSNKQDPTSDTRWFLLKNGCAYPVHVTWCNGQGCVNSSFASDIPSGGADEVWAKKDNDGKIHLNLMACQESSGSDEVFTDWPHKQCYADVEMN